MAARVENGFATRLEPDPSNSYNIRQTKEAHINLREAVRLFGTGVNERGYTRYNRACIRIGSGVDSLTRPGGKGNFTNGLRGSPGLRHVAAQVTNGLRFRASSMKMLPIQRATRRISRKVCVTTSFEL